MALGWSAATAGDDGRHKPTTAAEQYQALLKKYRDASSGGVLSDEERLRFVGRVYKLRDSLAAEFVELAEKYPKDPIAVDALLQAIWQVNGTPWPVELVGKDVAWLRAFTLLQRDHVRSDKLGPACQRLAGGYRKEYEAFLRTVLDKNPHKDVQAQACLALAHFLNSRRQRLDLIQEQPSLAKEFADLFGKEYLDELRKDRGKATQEEETLLERALEKYGDVKLPEGGTVSEKARAELFEIRHLQVGKEAPNIEGRDQDGNPLNLRDFRGKVVLLDFWSEF
jgi:hypothetical protein